MIGCGLWGKDMVGRGTIGVTSAAPYLMYSRDLFFRRSSRDQD